MDCTLGVRHENYAAICLFRVFRVFCGSNFLAYRRRKHSDLFAESGWRGQPMSGPVHAVRMV